VRAAALWIVRQNYADFGPTLAAEKLAAEHGFSFSSETLRKWMIADGLWRDRKQRKSIHQPRRRRDCVGELVQVDGSEHWWFEDRGPQCTLLVFVDDATSRLTHLQFVESESIFAYFHAATAFAAARFLPPGATGSGSREERDRLLAEAEVIIGGWPFPLDLRARAPRLKWLHQRQAGASNLLGSDLWGGDVLVTTSRGVANSLPIAEYAVAGILHFAMGFHRAVIDRQAGAFDHRAYRPLLVHGKTVCVVGAGGIGSEVGRLCAALGMRVVGTRRQPLPGAPLPQGFSEIGGAEALESIPTLNRATLNGNLWRDVGFQRKIVILAGNLSVLGSPSAQCICYQINEHPAGFACVILHVARFS
jgi:hypothetical protein